MTTAPLQDLVTRKSVTARPIIVCLCGSTRFLQAFQDANLRETLAGNPYVVYLQAAHVSHDHENPSPDLIAVCPRCHKRDFSKPRTARAVPWHCKRLQAIHRRYDRQEARKKLAQSRQASGASNETFLSKSLPTSPSYSSRVQFGWQLEEGRYE